MKHQPSVARVGSGEQGVSQIMTDSQLHVRFPAICSIDWTSYALNTKSCFFKFLLVVRRPIHRKSLTRNSQTKTSMTNLIVWHGVQTFPCQIPLHHKSETRISGAWKLLVNEMRDFVADAKNRSLAAHPQQSFDETTAATHAWGDAYDATWNKRCAGCRRMECIAWMSRKEAKAADERKWRNGYEKEQNEQVQSESANFSRFLVKGKVWEGGVTRLSSAFPRCTAEAKREKFADSPFNRSGVCEGIEHLMHVPTMRSEKAGKVLRMELRGRCANVVC